jgi:hypothetical protein
MKRTVLGALLGAGLAVVAVGVLDQRGEVFAQRLMPPPAAAADGQLIALSFPLGEKGQLITVIDPRQRAMGIYHVELPSGKIALRSVRDLRWDLQMTYYNNEPPFPLEIRSMLEQK